MIKFKFLLREDIPSEKEIEKFENLKGSYSFQGHISRDKNIKLRNTEPEDVDPTPYQDLKGAKAGGSYHTPFGFWTSTVYKSYDDFVTKWAKSWYRDTQDKYFHAYTITGNPEIVHLGSKSDVDEFYSRSNYGTMNKFEDEIFDWIRIAEDYDAFHVYGSALETKFFENWGVESTVWFNPKEYLKEQFVWRIREELSNDWE